MHGREFPVILYFFPVNQGLSGNYERALAIVEKSLGPEHPDVATSLENYALLLRKISRRAEAAKMNARAKAIRAKHARQNPAK